MLKQGQSCRQPDQAHFHDVGQQLGRGCCTRKTLESFEWLQKSEEAITSHLFALARDNQRGWEQKSNCEDFGPLTSFPGNKLNTFQSEEIKALSEPLTMTTINIYTQVIDGCSHAKVIDPYKWVEPKQPSSQTWGQLYSRSGSFFIGCELYCGSGLVLVSLGVFSMPRFSANTWEVPLPLQFAGYCEDFSRDLLGRY